MYESTVSGLVFEAVLISCGRSHRDAVAYAAHHETVEVGDLGGVPDLVPLDDVLDEHRIEDADEHQVDEIRIALIHQCDRRQGTGLLEPPKEGGVIGGISPSLPELGELPERERVDADLHAPPRQCRGQLRGQHIGIGPRDVNVRTGLMEGFDGTFPPVDILHLIEKDEGTAAHFHLRSDVIDQTAEIRPILLQFLIELTVVYGGPVYAGMYKVLYEQLQKGRLPGTSHTGQDLDRRGTCGSDEHILIGRARYQIIFHMICYNISLYKSFLTLICYNISFSISSEGHRAPVFITFLSYSKRRNGVLAHVRTVMPTRRPSVPCP